jgi:hypothetical protein
MGCLNCNENEGAEEGDNLIKEDTFGNIKIKVFLGSYTSALT